MLYLKLYIKMWTFCCFRNWTLIQKSELAKGNKSQKSKAKTNSTKKPPFQYGAEVTAQQLGEARSCVSGPEATALGVTF